MCVSIDELRKSVAEYAAGFDAALLSSGQAEQVVDEASTIERIASTVKALAAARVAETGLWRSEGDRSPAHHLARRTGTTVVQAASALDTARRLENLPETSAAARRGELSPEAASAIAAAAGVDPRAEHALLETARRVPLAELRDQCARTAAAAQADPEARRARIHRRRSLRAYTDTDGEWHLHCRNNPEVGASIMAALEPFREAIFRHARSEARREPPEAYAADALTEMARCSAGIDPECVGTGDTGSKRAGEAAGAAVETGGAKTGGPAGTGEPAGTAEATGGAVVMDGRKTGESAGEDGEPAAADAGGSEDAGGARRSGATGPPKVPRRAGSPKIIVRVDLEALLRGRATDGEVCEIAGFGPVAVSAVRDMIDSQDPFLAAVATRGERLIGVAHLGRRPNALQQTALQWLYPGCANESCSARARLDYDHRVDWATTHLTVLDLLDRLCQHCHALKTRQNWSLVEGRGKRPLVAPDDPRHPRNVERPERPGVAVDPRANGPPIRT